VSEGNLLLTCGLCRFKAMEKAGTDTVAEVVEDKPGE